MRKQTIRTAAAKFVNDVIRRRTTPLTCRDGDGKDDKAKVLAEIEELVDAVAAAIPFSVELDTLIERLDKLAGRFRSEQKHRTWPMAKELTDAVRAEFRSTPVQREAHTREHLEWLATFIKGTWSGGYPTYPPASCWGVEEARQLLDAGLVTEDDLEAIRWLSDPLRRELGLPVKPVDPAAKARIDDLVRQLAKSLSAKKPAPQRDKYRQRTDDHLWSLRRMGLYDHQDRLLDKALRGLAKALDEGDLEAARAAHASAAAATAAIEEMEGDAFGEAPAAGEETPPEVWEARAAAAKDDATRERFASRAEELRARMEESDG